MKGLPGAVRAGGDFQFQLQFAESLKSDHDHLSPAWQESMLWSPDGTANEGRHVRMGTALCCNFVNTELPKNEFSRGSSAQGLDFTLSFGRLLIYFGLDKIGFYTVETLERKEILVVICATVGSANSWHAGSLNGP